MKILHFQVVTWSSGSFLELLRDEVFENGKINILILIYKLHNGPMKVYLIFFFLSLCEEEMIALPHNN